MNLVDLWTKKLHYTLDEDDDEMDFIHTLCNRDFELKAIVKEEVSEDRLCKCCLKRYKESLKK